MTVRKSTEAKLPDAERSRAGIAVAASRVKMPAPTPTRMAGGRVLQLRAVPAATLVGLLALSFSVLYFVSDVIETLQGGFSLGQLWLTLIAEAAIPFIVVGLAVVQRPRIGRLGELSAVAYAYSYVFFTGTVVYALVNGTKDYDTLSLELGAWMTVHGAVMVLAGLGFGYAVLRARVLPAWTAVALMVGVVFVAAAQGLPAGAQLIAAGVRALGFAGMGVALLRHHTPVGAESRSR
jgi:hypothetical protein